MARRITLSIVTLIVAFCLGLSLIALSGAAVVIHSTSPSTAHLTPTPVR